MLTLARLGAEHITIGAITEVLGDGTAEDEQKALRGWDIPPPDPTTFACNAAAEGTPNRLTSTGHGIHTLAAGPLDARRRLQAILLTWMSSWQ